MKKTRKIISILLALIILLTPFEAFAKKSSSPFVSGSYTHNSRFDDYKRYNGIDISYYNGNINFEKVKKDGVNFAIIRIGYRGYAKKGNIILDSKYKEYIKNAKKAGIKVGVYFYSQAINKSEAVEEAEFVLKNLNGEELDLPIVWDIEFAGGNGSTGRLYNAKLSKSKMTENAFAFCDTVRSAGYEAMVYANKSFLKNNLYPEKLIEKDYKIWLAHYIKKTDYNGNYSVWQYSDKGKVNGISGYVDTNFMYVNTTKEFVVEKPDSYEYNGENIAPEIKVTYNSNLLTEGVDYTVKYSDNINIGCAKATVTGLGKYKNFKSKNVYFNIVPATVKNAKITKRSSSYLTIQWDKVANASGYQIQIYKNSTWQTIAATSDTSYTIKDLNAATNYSIRIRAYKKVNYIKYYSDFSAKLKGPTLPKQIENIDCVTGTNTLTLNWNKDGSPTGYYVYEYNNKTKEKSLYSEAQTNSIKVSGLSPNTDYSFTVVAYKTDENGKILLGKESNVFTFHTKPIAPKLSSIESNAAKKIKIKWNKNDKISGYQIKWSTNKDFKQNCKTQNAPSSATSATISTSKSKTKYYVKVRSYKTVNGKKVYSYWSNTLSVKSK